MLLCKMTITLRSLFSTLGNARARISAIEVGGSDVNFDNRRIICQVWGPSRGSDVKFAKLGASDVPWI